MGRIKNIISLGPGCGTAKSLEKIGARSQAGPFDWVTTKNFESIIELIENKFSDFLVASNIYQSDNVSEPQVYYDLKFNIGFYHDFNMFKSFESQFMDVKKKYNRRIERFLISIKEPTIFIREVNTAEEFEYIESKLDYLNQVIKYYNPENEFIFVTRNKELTSKKFRIILIKPKLPVPRFLWGLLKNNIESYNKDLYSKFYNPEIYSQTQRVINLKTYRRKNTFFLLRKIHKKVSYTLKVSKHKDKIYRHSLIAKSEYGGIYNK